MQSPTFAPELPHPASDSASATPPTNVPLRAAPIAIPVIELTRRAILSNALRSAAPAHRATEQHAAHILGQWCEPPGPPDGPAGGWWPGAGVVVVELVD